MLEAGQAAPDFTLPDQDGEELTLSELRGQTVVLYFYPRADTPGLRLAHVGPSRLTPLAEEVSPHPRPC